MTAAQIMAKRHELWNKLTDTEDSLALVLGQKHTPEVIRRAKTLIGRHNNLCDALFHVGYHATDITEIVDLKEAKAL